VLIPVKRFTAAKGRLTGVLTDDHRARLASWMATRVVEVVAEAPTFVACDDAEVADWAQRKGATVLWGPGLGLNGAVDDGIAHIAAAGYDHVMVSHADLARPAALLSVPAPSTITLVPDRRHDGTNVMSFPTDERLTASYGGGSFRRHLAQALSSGAATQVHVDLDLALDLDTAADLAHPLIREVLPSWLPTSPVNR
jgi:2-phospho-L-lactate guanylyltransferase